MKATARFTTRVAQYAEHHGTRVTVVRPLTAAEVEPLAVGSMFRVRFGDGTEADVWADELDQWRPPDEDEADRPSDP